MIPDPAVTIRFIGDTHLGANGRHGGYGHRLQKFVEGWTDISPIHPDVPQGGHVGDILEGEVVGGDQQPYAAADQLVVARQWIDDLGTPIIETWGNHDDFLPMTREAWEAGMGQPVRKTVDLPFCRVATFNFAGFGAAGAGAEEKAWLETVTEESGLPVVAVGHYPMTDVIGAARGTRLNLSPLPQMPAGHTTHMRQVIGRQPNLKAFVNGHAHPWYDSAGIVAKITEGSLSVAHVNALATTYIGQNTAWFSNPMFEVHVSLLDDGERVQTRLYNVGAKQWWFWPQVASHVWEVAGL